MLGLVIAVALALVGCTSTPAASPSATPGGAFTDDQGLVIQLPAQPQKIVSLTPAATETLFAIGAGSRVVAKVEDLAAYPPEAGSLPVVATYKGVDVEKIRALGADLVLAGGSSFTPQPAIDQLRGLGIPVLVLDPHTVAAVLHDIELVGDAVGDGPAARIVTAAMQTRIDAIKATLASASRPRTFYEVDATSDIFGPARDSFLAELVTTAGGTPITSDNASVYSIALEKLVAADPEVIVLGDSAYGTTPDVVRARAGWGTISAVKSSTIRPIDDTVVTRPGPRLVDGLQLLAAAIHPELAAALGVPSPTGAPGASGGPAGSSGMGASPTP